MGIAEENREGGIARGEAARRRSEREERGDEPKGASTWSHRATPPREGDKQGTSVSHSAVRITDRAMGNKKSKRNNPYKKDPPVSALAGDTKGGKKKLLNLSSGKAKDTRHLLEMVAVAAGLLLLWWRRPNKEEEAFVGPCMRVLNENPDKMEELGISAVIRRRGRDGATEKLQDKGIPTHGFGHPLSRGWVAWWLHGGTPFGSSPGAPSRQLGVRPS